MILKIEMHIHTSEVSPCGMVPAAEMVRAYKKAGYDALVITDHFNDYVLETYRGGDEQRVRCFLRGYEKALEAGEKYGIKVLLGAESNINTGGHEDFLLYGIDPEFLYEHPYLYRMKQKEVYELCHERGYLLFQAHPCRSYCQSQNPVYLDGVEIYNGNPRQDNNNEETRAWAAMYPHFLFSSGSDYHQKEDLGRGGIITGRKVENNQDLVIALKEGVEIIEAGGTGRWRV